ncbi:AAA family ATPase [uncultured Thermanaerothrix sp.]|uniref:AAA family ATPase n=1 Tax=uncultured Thermanaerothrix sp. TaxID=1195149 RepID=UPI00262EAAD0|nr:AAA family ATPase [uncultured Thermanaerothrix sp.]
MQAEESTRPSLVVYLFGRPEVFRDNQLLPPLATQKTQSLLAYLIIHRNRSHLRDELAALFWGDRDDVHARHSLTTALWRIRRLLGKEYLLADSVSVQFDPNSSFWLDVAEFEKRVKRSSHEPVDLALAVDLYRGDLLEGFYDDWCLEERYYLEALYLDALKRLLDWHEAQGNAQEVLVYAQKYLVHDPLMQNVHLAAVRALVTLGDLTGARRQWQLYCETLQQELHALPTPETLKQAENLLGAYFTVPLSLGPVGVKTPPHWDVLDRPPFVGRGREMNALQACWEQAIKGHGHVVLISGEAGVGKTRLTEEFAALVRWHGGVVAHGRCYESERILPHQLLTEILQELIQQEGQLWLELPIWTRNELARLIPELYLPTQSAPLPSSMLPDRQAILFHAATMLIRQFASRTPLLVVLEDLHWATETTLAAIHYLVRQTFDVPVLYLATFRPEGVLQTHTLTDTTAQLVRDGLAKHLLLERLPIEAVADLVQRTMNYKAADIKRLYEHTQGNAFFTIETLRALAVTPFSEGTLPIPDTVRDLIQSRLGRLSPLAREWITFAAVAGRSFDLDLVRCATGVDEDTALEVVDELLQRGFLCEGSGATGSDYEFIHHLVHETTYLGIHHRKRQRLHRLIGEAIERLYGDVASVSADLAHHFDAGGEMKRALHYHGLAAQRAISVFAWQEAEEHLKRMLGLIERLDPGCNSAEYLHRRSQILIDRAELCSLQARLEERDAHLEALRMLAESSGDAYVRLQTKVQRARYLNLDSQYEQAIQVAQEGVVLADRLQDKATYCLLLTQIGFAHYFLGNPRLALTALDSALRMAPETDDETRRHLLHILGYVHFHLGNYGCALAYQQESYTAHQMIGDYNGMAWAGLDMAATFQKMGRMAEAEQCLTQHLKLAQHIGARSAEGYGLVQAGSWELCQGHYVVAEETFHQALAIQKGLRTEHGRVAAEIGIGFSLYHQGDAVAAQHWLEQALERARSIRHRRRIVEALIGLGLVACSVGQYQMAHQFLTEAVAEAQVSECRGNLAAGLVALACAERHLGRLLPALANALEAVQIADEIAVPVLKMWAEVESGLVRLAQGDSELALVHTQRAVNLIPQCDESWIGTEQVYRAHSRALRALGHFEIANEVDSLSSGIIEAKASRIPHPQQQQHYREFASRDP